MHVARSRALRSSTPAAALAKRFSSLTRCDFHHTSQPRKSPASGSSPAPDRSKPSSQAETERHDTTNAQDSESAFESTARRARGSTFAAGRTRITRPKVSDDLPPVSLPRHFLENNITAHDSSRRLKAIAEDPVFCRRHVGSQWRSQWRDWLWQDLAVVLDTASWDHEGLSRAVDDIHEGRRDFALRRSLVLGETAQWLDAMLKDGWDPISGKGGGEAVAKAFLEGNGSSAVISTIMAPNRRADPRKENGEMSTVTSEDDILRMNIDNYIQQIAEAEGTNVETDRAKLHRGTTNSLEYHGSRIFASRDFAELSTALRTEMRLEPEQNTERKDLRRPIIVVNIPNYTGTYAARKLLERMATHLETDLLRIDAQDLASIVGGYLGQDTAYCKGSMSMLGYRTAEMNGRLRKGVESPDTGDSDVGDTEAAWVNIRQQGSGSSFRSPMEEELHKIKEGSRDYLLPSVDRWENLKITTALEQMIQAALARSTGDAKALLVHVDNFVELNMTLEGALLLGRLRSLVDSLWQRGRKIVLVGTSSSESPSEQYTTTLAAIGSEETLSHFPIEIYRIPDGEKKKKQRRQMDYLHENFRNIHAMSRALDGRTGSEASVFSQQLTRSTVALGRDDTSDVELERYLKPYVEQWHGMPEVLDAIMPCADVHYVTRLVHGMDFPRGDPAISVTLLEILLTRDTTIDQRPWYPDSGEQAKRVPERPIKQNGESETLSTGGAKYNEFEKKLLTGLVDVNEIKTTFADVHAPPETTAALKLLTSLSLRRPEAFTYGILANDRIPGCLLYGPPGTGKTLLAKAVAKESGASMLEVSGASINDMYVGQSEKNVRALFSLAKKLSPLVIFIDEADALFAARGQSRSRPAHRETINQFLREWDGMSDTKAFIMVATNRPFDLDDAVLRRLPRKILVDLPLQVDRAAILRILLKGEQLDDSVSIDDISRSTVLYSGSDLKNLCVAAAMSAVQEELEEATRHEGPVPYAYPERRTLRNSHFDKAAKEIAASISEDMDSLKSIRKFDQKYGDQRSRHKKSRGMGFGVLPSSEDAEDARVRQPSPA